MNLCTLTEKIKISSVLMRVSRHIAEKTGLIILKEYVNIVGKHLFLENIRNEDFAVKVVRHMQDINLNGVIKTNEFNNMDKGGVE